MIIYEVNLTIDNEIFNEYYSWLLDHIKEMLKIKGFCSAEIAKEILDENDDMTISKITVRYHVDNLQNLNDYFKYHATQMRKEGQDKFGNKFSAFRRIFQEPIVL